tara:strand:+ start:2385 stop:3392 length:1008 start_codon:yes stop_codon:yes gene_type:complete
MRIIVTGGCGFIGSTLIKKLITNKKNLVLNIDSLNKVSMPESLNKIKINKNYHFKKTDIRNKKKLLEIILEFKPNRIFHLAAESHVDRSITNPDSFLTSNIIGTYNLLESSKIFLSKNKKFTKNFKIIHVSTDEVYGSLNFKERAFKETNKFLPNSPYSASKASSDLICRAWFKTYKIPVITTNCSNNYGPWQFPEKLIPVVISKILQNKKIPIYGSGKNIRDWIHVEDHTDALIKISNKGKIGETYNIGDNNEISNLDLVKHICKIFDEIKMRKVPSKKLISFVKDRLGHDFRYSINSKKIENKLNFRCQIKFSNGLRQTVNWYLENEKWLIKK